MVTDMSVSIVKLTDDRKFLMTNSHLQSSDNLKLIISVHLEISFSYIPRNEYCPKRPNRPYNAYINSGIFFHRNCHLSSYDQSRTKKYSV